MTRLYSHMVGGMIPRAQNFILPNFLSRDMSFFFTVSELNKILVGILDQVWGNTNRPSSYHRYLVLYFVKHFRSFCSVSEKTILDATNKNSGKGLDPKVGTKLQVALWQPGMMERMEAAHLYALVVSTVTSAGTSQLGQQLTSALTLSPGPKPGLQPNSFS